MKIFFPVPDAVNPIDIFTPFPLSIRKTVTRCVHISAVTIRIVTAFPGIMEIIIGWGGERDHALSQNIHKYRDGNEGNVF